MQLALVVGIIVFQPVGVPQLSVEEVTFVELLRDTQATQIAAYKAGEMVADLHIEDVNKGVTVALSIEVQWDGSNSLWKYKGDEMGLSFGRQGSEAANIQGLDRQKWQYMCVLNGSLYAYNESQFVVYRKPATTLPPLLGEALPVPAWFNCCPPNSHEGRPWAELIGIHPAMPQIGLKSLSLTFDRAGNSIVQERVTDAGKITTEFALSLGGNVARVEIVPTTSQGEARQGVYHWEKGAGKQVLLRGYKFFTSPGRRTELKVKSLKLRPTPITLGKFLSRLPSNVMIKDLQDHRPPTAPTLNDAAFKPLIEKLKQDSYIRKD